MSHNNEYLKSLGVPWYYRCRFINWLMDKPWLVYPISKKGHRYGTIYKAMRAPDYVRNEETGVYVPVPGTEKCPRWKAAWWTITFPHVHHDLEN